MSLAAFALFVVTINIVPLVMERGMTYSTAAITLAVWAGAARGCHTLLQATAVSDRCGTQNFARIKATVNAPITALSALAPVTGPALAAAFGSYTLMGITMAGLLVLVTFGSAKT